MEKRPEVIPKSCGRCPYFTRTGVVQGRCRFYDAAMASMSPCLAGPADPPVAEAPGDGAGPKLWQAEDWRGGTRPVTPPPLPEPLTWGAFWKAFWKEASPIFIGMVVGGVVGYLSAWEVPKAADVAVVLGVGAGAFAGLLVSMAARAVSAARKDG